MKYVVDPKLRDERNAAVQNLSSIVAPNIEQTEEKLYKILKQNYSQKEVINLFLNKFAEALSLVLKELKKIYKKEYVDQIEVSDLEYLFYNADGITLTDRIKNWFEKYPNKKTDLEHLFHALCRIYEHEIHNITINATREKVKADYVEVIFGGGPDWIVPCVEWADGAIHPIGWPEPPFHPLCECWSVYYVEEDVTKEDE